MADKIPDLHAEVRAGTRQGGRPAQARSLTEWFLALFMVAVLDPVALQLDFNKC